ncbi:hypothetical protein [Rhodococcus aerolatus]
MATSDAQESEKSVLEETKEATPDGPDAREVSRSAKAVTRFAAAHGGSTRAVVQGVAAHAFRITLVGADGILGDVVVADAETADAVLAEAGVEAAEWDRELSASVELSAAHRARMAGRAGC